MFVVTSNRYPRVEIRWPVSALTTKETIAGETKSISMHGAYIRCSKPLKLNEITDITINIPNSDRVLTARAEVVWTNMYGPDDKMTPRGMGVRFLDIASEDQEFIAKVLYDNSLEKVATDYLKTLGWELGEK